MYTEVIPYGKSFGTETLTYSVGASFRKEIKIGQLVEIPYGKENILGIVAFCYENLAEGRENIKEILSIISPFPLLAEYQIKTILQISQKYCLAIHRVLGIFLPVPLINRLKKYNFPLEIQTHTSKPLQHQIFLKREGIISANTILNFLKPNSILVVPDDIFLENLRKNITRDDILFIGNDITDTKRSQAWIDIYNYKFSLCIGTRKLLFANLSAYSEIWYIEDSFSYDYYHFPIRIEYTDILAHYADNNRISLKIFTSIPRLKTLSQFHYFQLNHI